jgi:colicin import membrane protein
MSERPRENSVLFSLRELRRIEDDRVKKEQEAARAKAEAERQAKENAERAAREAEEQRVRNEQDRLRREQDEEQERHREGQLRLQEAERRARVEGEMRINEERMRLEMHHKKKHSPVKAVVTVTVVLLAIGGGVGYKMYNDHQKELAAARLEKERVEAEAKKARAELEARLVGMEKDFADKLKNAKSAEEIERLKAERAQARLDIQAGRAVKAHPKAAPVEEKPILPVKTEKRKISDNPLDGLDLDEPSSSSSSSKKKKR